MAGGGHGHVVTGGRHHGRDRTERRDDVRHALEVGGVGAVAAEHPGRPSEQVPGRPVRTRSLASRHRMTADEVREVRPCLDHRRLHAGDVGDEGICVEPSECVHHRGDWPGEHDQVRSVDRHRTALGGDVDGAEAHRLVERRAVRVPSRPLPPGSAERDPHGCPDQAGSEDRRPGHRVRRSVRPRPPPRRRRPSTRRSRTGAAPVRRRRVRYRVWDARRP